MINVNEIKFWSYVKKSNDCWIWLAYKDKDGYGTFRVGDKKYRAHRISYFLSRGNVPHLYVCHSCDNPSCVNPDHLWEGTNSENQLDCSKKGRKPKQRPKSFKLLMKKITKTRKRNEFGMFV